MRKIVAIILALLICVMPVFAELQAFEVKNIQGGVKLQISGKLDASEEDKAVAVEIIEEGYSFDSITSINSNTAVAFADQTVIKTGENDFSFVARIDGATRLLKGKLYIEGMTEGHTFDVKYVENNDFAVSAAAVNGALASIDSLATKIGDTEVGNSKSNAFILNFDYVIDSDVTVLETAKYLHTELSQTPLSTTDKDAAAKLWKQASLLALMAEKDITDISAYSECIDLTNAKTKSWYEMIVENPSAKAMLTRLVNAKEYNKISDFDTALKENIILTVIAFPDGNDNIGLVLNDFSSLTGITETNKTLVYSQMAGKTYSSLAAALEEYGRLAGNPQDDGNDGGTSGGSSGSGNRVSDSTLTSIQSPDTQLSGDIQTINMKFIDLDSVPWAYTAISALTEMGVISGKSETLFMPEETITREEFAKLCVCALGGKVSGKNVFSDAKADEWYNGYINAAFEMGICKGVSDGVFGVGQNVSRQDIAVMLYRMIEGKTNTEANVNFADSERIADYAREAVEQLAGLGIINGVGANRFAPNDSATRAEAAKMLYGIVNILNGNK